MRWICTPWAPTQQCLAQTNALITACLVVCTKPARLFVQGLGERAMTTIMVRVWEGAGASQQPPLLALGRGSCHGQVSTGGTAGDPGPGFFYTFGSSACQFIHTRRFLHHERVTRSSARPCPRYQLGLNGTLGGMERSRTSSPRSRQVFQVPGATPPGAAALPPGTSVTPTEARPSQASSLRSGPKACSPNMSRSSWLRCPACTLRVQMPR